MIIIIIIIIIITFIRLISTTIPANINTITVAVALIVQIAGAPSRGVAPARPQWSSRRRKSRRRR